MHTGTHSDTSNPLVLKTISIFHPTLLLALRAIMITLAPTVRQQVCKNLFFVNTCFYKKTSIHTHTKTSISTYQLRAKKMKLQLAVLLISVLLEGSVAILSQRVGNCLTRFEQSLKEITDDKKYCVNANIQDCCQVRYLL